MSQRIDPNGPASQLSARDCIAVDMLASMPKPFMIGDHDYNIAAQATQYARVAILIANALISELNRIPENHK